MKSNPFDSAAISRQHYASLLSGHYRMRGNYRIVRPAGTADWLLFLTVAGGGLLSGADGTACLRPGTLGLYPPGVSHDYRTDPRAGVWDFYWIHFRAPAVWAPFLDWKAAGGSGAREFGLSVLPAAEARLVRRLVREAVCRAGEFTSLGDAFAMNALEAVFLHCCRRAGGGGPAAFADEVRAYIRLHPQGDLGVPALAARFHLSPSRFAFRFRRELGVTPQVFVESQRMELARCLLESKRWPVKQVALSVGYGDPLYFSKRFRRYFGAPPHEIFPSACHR
jgi:AraC family transcriptional regulator of arabinose operon